MPEGKKKKIYLISLAGHNIPQNTESNTDFCYNAGFIAYKIMKYLKLNKKVYCQYKTLSDF